MRSTHALRCVVLGTFVSAAAVFACSSLDLAYAPPSVNDGGANDGDTGEGGSSSGDTPRIIRDSSFEAESVAPVGLVASDARPCNPDEEVGGGCDQTQGLGCCFGPTGPHCIYPWEMNAYQCQVFVGCREDDPSTESECCWNESGGVRFSALATSCASGGRQHACVDYDGSVGCPSGQACSTAECDVDGGTWQIGICGGTIACP